MKIELPQVGESVTDGVISRWLKNIGDSIEEYEPLVEVVTDKVNMEVPCPVSGILTNILVQEGETVPMGTTIAEINVGDESVPDLNNDSDEGITKDTKLDRIGTLLKDVSPVGPTGSGGPISEGIEIGKSKRQRYSPAVIRLAKQHNIDLNRINGTGIGGRVSKKDVQLFINSKAATTEKMDGVDVMPITPLRRLIANNMVESSNQIPDAWTMVEADVSGLVDLRENTKELFIKREGVKLTYLAFVVNIVSRALKAHSKLNSTWERESIILKNRINIGVAVSTTTGLVVPVIHDADKLSIGDIAKSISSLVEKARNSKLSLSDVKDGTFTINNTGALGSVAGKAIINLPEAAILNTESIIKRPVVIEDKIIIRSIMNLCLTFDHRIMDGAEAGAFINDVKLNLESIDHKFTV
tara:strand:+ start:17389 stop:18624 length:1236 start_codon:yes stop_codon:yes gene_type:complete